MADRLAVNITLAKNRQTGAVQEVFQYSGAVEIQTSGSQGFTMEFRGILEGQAVGADAAARMADAEAKVRTEILAKLDASKAKVPTIPTAGSPGSST